MKRQKLIDLISRPGLVVANGLTEEQFAELLVQRLATPGKPFRRASGLRMLPGRVGDWIESGLLRVPSLKEEGERYSTQAPDPARPSVQLFTDGACIGNPGPGGWAFILKYPKRGSDLTGSGGEVDTTNNRMELLAVIQGLKALKRPANVDLFADSQYVLKGLAEWIDGWKARGWRTSDKSPVLNRELWEEADSLRRTHILAFGWIKGHSGHPENEACDRFAMQEARRVQAAARSRSTKPKSDRS